MAVSITPNFRRADIQKVMRDKKEWIEAAILSRLQFIGEAFVKDARESGSYEDQTGNLRNSIGYVILKDGKQLQENFKKSAKIKSIITRGKNKGKEKISSGSAAGIAQSQALIETIKQKYPRGFVLIVVAGMEYAAAVEDNGRTVLTASGKRAEVSLKNAMIELSKNLKRA